MVKIGRVILSMLFAAGALALAYWFATMPYELITTTSTTTRAIPDGGVVFILAVIFGVLALIAAFSGNWD